MYVLPLPFVPAQYALYRLVEGQRGSNAKEAGKEGRNLLFTSQKGEKAGK